MNNYRVAINTHQKLYFSFHQPGHFKKQCKAFKDAQKQNQPSESFQLESGFSYVKPFSCWAYSRAIIHVSNDLQEFKEIRKIEDGSSFIYMRNNDKTLVGVGTNQLKLPNKKTFDLKECLYAPSTRRNLLSIFCLEKTRL